MTAFDILLQIFSFESETAADFIETKFPLLNEPVNCRP